MRPLLVALMMLASCGTIDRAGDRADETVTKAIDRATASGVQILDCAASRASIEAKATIDHATAKLHEATDNLITKLLVELRALLADTIKLIATELLDKINRWSNRTLERIESKTLPQAREQTVGLLDDIGKWWDKILMGLVTAVSSFIMIRERMKRGVAEKTVGAMVEAQEQVGQDPDEFREQVRKALKNKVPLKTEYAIRQLIRKKRDGS